MENDTFQTMKQAYSNLTTVEKSIANFFITNKEASDFASRKIAKLLYVSEATLSRFAQKIGYSGYREFIFNYTKDLQTSLTRLDPPLQTSENALFDTYQTLIKNTLSLYRNETFSSLISSLHHTTRCVLYAPIQTVSALLPLQRTLLAKQTDTQLIFDDETLSSLPVTKETTYLLFFINEIPSFLSPSFAYLISDHQLPDSAFETILLPYDSERGIHREISLFVFINMLIDSLAKDKRSK